MYTILSNRSLLKISGTENYKFLQGLITNDINKLKTQVAIYTCMLTPQGKFFADFFLYALNDDILVDLSKDRKFEILNKLKIYKLRSEVIFKELTDYEVVSFTEEARRVFDKLSGQYIFTDPRSTELGLRGFIHKQDLNQITSLLIENKDGYDNTRIKNFIAEGEKDLIADKSFILEYGIDKFGAVDFTKGCYVGQELVARTYHRGTIRKEITQIFSLENLPPPNTIINAGNDKIGIICTSTANKGLALINREIFENLTKEAELTAAGIKIQIKFMEKEK